MLPTINIESNNGDGKHSENKQTDENEAWLRDNEPIATHRLFLCSTNEEEGATACHQVFDPAEIAEILWMYYVLRNMIYLKHCSIDVCKSI
jgi:hypothetical protein